MIFSLTKASANSAGLTVTSHVGRKKVTKRHGILRETFPAVFIVELSHASYSRVFICFLLIEAIALVLALRLKEVKK